MSTPQTLRAGMDAIGTPWDRGLASPMEVCSWRTFTPWEQTEQTSTPADSSLTPGHSQPPAALGDGMARYGRRLGTCAGCQCIWGLWMGHYPRLGRWELRATPIRTASRDGMDHRGTPWGARSKDVWGA